MGTLVPAFIGNIHCAECDHKDCSRGNISVHLEIHTLARLSEHVMKRLVWVILISMNCVKMWQVKINSISHWGEREKKHWFFFILGPEVCIDPPVASDYGFLNRTWDGGKEIQVSKVNSLIIWMRGWDKETSWGWDGPSSN